jgi:hypothetical protein
VEFSYLWLRALAWARPFSYQGHALTLRKADL